MHKHAKRLLAALAAAASAQSWPTQPIRWIVPYPAGGAPRDGRRRHGKPLGQTIVVENRPGAATIIGATAVSQEPSGYMIGTADSGTLAFNPSCTPSCPDPSKFTYIGGIAKFPLLAVNVNSPYKSVADVIAAARKRLTAACGRRRLAPIWRWSCSARGAELLHVPYKGAAPAIQDLLGGRVDVMFIDLAPA